MSLLALALALAAPARGAELRVPEEPLPPVSVSTSASAGELATRYLESLRLEERALLVERLAATRPRTPQDLRAMLNLYQSRDEAGRRAVESSLALLSPSDAPLGEVFVGLMEMDVASFQLFGMMGAYQVRAPGGLPLLRRWAAVPLSKEPGPRTPAAEAEAWRRGVQAAEALALWEGEEGYARLLKKASETPALAAPLALHFWERALPELVRWSDSKDARDQERAKRAWAAPIETARVRATLPALRALVSDRKRSLETRRRAAARLGSAATPEDVAGLLADREAERDERTRLLLTSAIFASGDPRAVPLLEEYVRAAPQAAARAGALFQLSGMLERERYRELLRWVAEQDPDEGNRREARQQLGQ